MDLGNMSGCKGMKRLVNTIMEVGEIVVGIVWWLVVFYFMLTIRP